MAVLPEASLTVHITVVLPNGNEAGALLVTLDTEQLSEVVGVPRLTPVAEHDEALAMTVTVAGAVMEGA